MPKLFLGFLRWALILGATGATVKWLWGVHWALGLFLALPAFVILMNIIGFLTIPLYFYTPEAQLARKTLKDFDEKGSEPSRKQKMSTKKLNRLRCFLSRHFKVYYGKWTSEFKLGRKKNKSNKQGNG